MNNPALSRALTKAGATAAFLLLVALSSLPKSSTLFFTWPWVFYGQLLLLLPITLLGWQLIANPDSWRRSWNILGYTALAIGLSTACSRRPAFSLEAALFLWSGLAWCGLVALETQRVLLAGSTYSTQLIRIFRIIGLIILFPLATGLALWAADLKDAALLTGSLWKVIIHFTTVRNSHPLGHWNYTGGYALLSGAWLAALAWTEKGRWRLFWYTGLVLACIIFFSASSRGAVLGAVASIVTGVALLSFKLRWSKRQLIGLVLIGLIVTSGLIMTNPRLRAIVFEPNTAHTPNEGDVQRIGMLQGGWLLVQKSPWIGHGSGMTPFVYPEVRAKLIGGVETSYQLHNGPLQLWVDHGLLGLLCAALLGIALLRSTLGWLKSPMCALRTFALASASALIGYFVLFVTDYQLNVVAFVAALGLQAGIVLAAPKESTPHSWFRNRWLGGTMLAAGITILVVLIPAWRARQCYWSAWDIDQPAEQLVLLERTVELAPRNPYYLNQLALRRARLAETTSNPTAASTLRTQARAELTHSLTLDPAQEPAYASLGWLWLDEDPKQAEQNFRAAIALLPDRDTLHLGLALSRLAQGDQPGAVREFALECLANPHFVASPFWTQEPLPSLRAGVMEQLLKDYAHALQLPATPQWRKPQLIYASAFMHWWIGGQPPTTAELKGALPYQQQFFAQLATPNQPPATDQLYPWDLLAQAKLSPSKAEAILSSPTQPPTKQAIAGALARLSRAAPDFATLLRSSEPTHIGMVSNQITRVHYSIMHCVLDGPGYEDFAPRITDAFTAEYAGSLFPLRSSIPGPVMLELMSQSQ